MTVWRMEVSTRERRAEREGQSEDGGCGVGLERERQGRRVRMAVEGRMLGGEVARGRRRV